MVHENANVPRGTAEFIQERKYLKNVTTKTIDCYGHSFKAFEGVPDSPEGARSRIVQLRQRVVSAISVDTYLRCTNAFWRWRGNDWKIPRVRQEQKILATFDKQQVKALIAFKPVGTNERRVHTLATLILDTGLRINEARLVTPADIDMENMPVTAVGRGVRSGRSRFLSKCEKFSTVTCEGFSADTCLEPADRRRAPRGTFRGTLRQSARKWASPASAAHGTGSGIRLQGVTLAPLQHPVLLKHPRRAGCNAALSQSADNRVVQLQSHCNGDLVLFTGPIVRDSL